MRVPIEASCADKMADAYTTGLSQCSERDCMETRSYFCSKSYLFCRGFNPGPYKVSRNVSLGLRVRSCHGDVSLMVSGLLLNAASVNARQSEHCWEWQGRQYPVPGSSGWSFAKQGTAVLTGARRCCSQRCGLSAAEQGCQPSSSQPARETGNDNGPCLKT